MQADLLLVWIEMQIVSEWKNKMYNFMDFFWTKDIDVNFLFHFVPIAPRQWSLTGPLNY